MICFRAEPNLWFLELILTFKLVVGYHVVSRAEPDFETWPIKQQPAVLFASELICDGSAGINDLLWNLKQMYGMFILI